MATRITDKQTGVVTSLEELTSNHLATLLGEVLNNSMYRDNARKLQMAIADANGLSVAADLIEDLVRPSRSTTVIRRPVGLNERHQERETSSLDC